MANRASVKLHPSPSSASSYSNTSSLFRDDGFEDDFASTASERASTYNSSTSASTSGSSSTNGTHPNSHPSHHLHHRRSFQGSRNSLTRRSHQYHFRRSCANDGDEYQSCEEEFATTSNTSASTSSNIDDCALSTTSSSFIIQQDLRALEKLSLADAKKQYRKSLLIEQQLQQPLHQEQQHHQQQPQTKIQSLLTLSPKFCHLSLTSGNRHIQNANSDSPSNHHHPTSASGKQSKCDDRTVNIIGHMPTKNPGYWDSNLSITQRVVTEIIETERTYVDDLEQIVTGYICYLRNVLKKQRHQQSQKILHHYQQTQHLKRTQKSASIAAIGLDRMLETDKNSAGNRTTTPTDDDDKSLLVFDDDSGSVNNEVDDVDDEEEEEEEGVVLGGGGGKVPQTRGPQTELDLTKTSKPKVAKKISLHELSSHTSLLFKQTSVDCSKSNDTNSTSNASGNSLSKATLATSGMLSKETSIDGAIMTANHIENLFSNLEDIYNFNKALLFRLEECYLDPRSVAECFVENSAGFEVYTQYCTSYPQVVSTLTELMSNQTSAQLLRERQNELNQGLPLGAYLLKPVQRILKYHILFQSLITHTENDATVDDKDRQLISEAFSVMTSIASHINAMKKRHEHAIRVQEVQGLLQGWMGPDLTTLGELILEDTFKLYNRPKTNRHLFLFDNVLLMTKKKRDGSLSYKGHIQCSNLMLIENIEGQPLVFNTVPFDNPKALCAFQAKNLDKKREWCLQMKEVIIKSFEVKIPVHVKDILMSLTKTNSATDLDSSKASSETMNNKALLRAPNYLERKKAKQDKRK